jgi:hypothetical protein
MQLMRIYQPCECEDSLAYAVKHDGGKIDFDFSSEVIQGRIEGLASVFIDNSQNDTPLSVRSSDTGQIIICPPYHQGYFKLTCHDPKFIVEGSKCDLIFMNYEVTVGVWNAKS